MLGRTLNVQSPLASVVVVPIGTAASSPNSRARIVITSPALFVETVPLSVAAAQHVTADCEATIDVSTITFAGASATTAVAAEVVTSNPNSFTALTATRSVEPTSPRRTVYVCFVSPETATHLAPAALQRCHW